MLDQGEGAHASTNRWMEQAGVARVKPDSVLYCPFPSRVNAHAHKAQRWSVAWARRFSLLGEEAEYQHLSASKIGWLVGRSFHVAPAEALQIAADWTTFFCILDDRVESSINPLSLAASLSGLLDVFKARRPPRDDEPMERALDDLRQRMLDRSDQAWVDGFVRILDDLFTAFTWETINRRRSLKPDVQSYCKMRRMTVGLYPQFYFSRITNGVRLPSKILRHPVVRRFEQATVNCVGWANDIFTHEKEREAGEIHNLVFRLQERDSLSLEVAVEKAIEMHDAEVRLFQSLESRLSIFGDFRDEVEQYVVILRSWIRGHLDWAVETGRYKAGSSPDLRSVDPGASVTEGMIDDAELYALLAVG